MPSYNLFDLGLSYTFTLNNNNKLVITGNIYNVFDTYYLSDGKSSIFTDEAPSKLRDGSNNTQKLTYDQLGYTYKGIATGNQVYFGFGRTWSASISYRF